MWRDIEIDDNLMGDRRIQSAYAISGASENILTRGAILKAMNRWTLRLVLLKGNLKYSESKDRFDFSRGYAKVYLSKALLAAWPSRTKHMYDQCSEFSCNRGRHPG